MCRIYAAAQRALCAISIVGILSGSFACAADPIHVVKIVENWELTLNSPDASTTAPQVTTTFGPFAHLNSFYATFELNHQATPEFATGGLHFHAWRGEQCLASRHQAAGLTLNSTGEVIRWKQVLELADGNLKLSIQDGSSSTWGSFGGDEMSFSIATDMADLNTYRPSFSVGQSGVGYAGGRVKQLAIVKLVAYTSAGQVAESDRLRVAHETK
jgi:hypothetical protein